MVLWRKVAIWLPLVALTVLPVGTRAEPPTEGGQSEPVRLYTNTDLERLGPVGVDAEPAATLEDPGWEFVTEFLEREYERMDAERSWELERRRATLEEDEASRRHRCSARCYPRYGYPFGHAGYRTSKQTRRAGPVPRSSVGGPIVPLHARPTQAMAQRARAIRRSGTDAFPSRARSSR